jgi:hypothetical protein
MEKLYLGFNALMYGVFAAWCAAAPKQTGDFVGLSAIGPTGQSEYLAVYGGLQAGLALFYGLALFSSEHQRSALWMSALLYGGIAAFRSLAVLRRGFAELGSARMFYLAEIVLFVAAVLLLRRRAG